MSAIVCGKRSSFFDEDPVSKRFRRSSSSSPIRFSPPRQSTGSPPRNSSIDFSSALECLSKLDHLIALFPDMEKQLLERALEECGGDLDSAIRSLNELRLGSAAGKSVATQEAIQFSAPGILTGNGEATPAEDPSASQSLPMDGADWVDLFVTEMKNSSNMDDARARVSKVLEVLEKSICELATKEAAQNFQQEYIMLKQQVEGLCQENTILKRAVSLQHERQKEFEDRGQELHHLKQLVTQYQEQLRTLEVNNYALSMHLKQAQQSNSMPGRSHPDVF
ncbi:unnamed protein product [Ilex paraguariensis]|uniref:CUE domain-containing protein n=1 Tax=Ilex paraguariensis TaxID=185542 RepID=A0ABC8TTX3_9AQUA